MPVKFIHGNIMKSERDITVVPVNCRGVMNKGFAKKARNAMPNDDFNAYMKHCTDGMMKTGDCFFSGSWCFAATRKSWMEKSSLENVEKAIINIKNVLNGTGKKIAMPLIGIGEDSVKREDIIRLVSKHLDGIDCTVYLDAEIPEKI